MAERAGGKADPTPKATSLYTYIRSFQDPDGIIFQLTCVDVNGLTQLKESGGNYIQKRNDGKDDKDGKDGKDDVCKYSKYGTYGKRENDGNNGSDEHHRGHMGKSLTNRKEELENSEGQRFSF